jgi:hypothetical protein
MDARATDSRMQAGSTAKCEIATTIFLFMAIATGARGEAPSDGEAFIESAAPNAMKPASHERPARPR